MDRLTNIKDEYSLVTVNMRDKYRQVLTFILEEMGMLDTHVRQKSSGKIGILKTFATGYAPSQQYIRFHPLKKDGTISKNSNGSIYAWCEDDFKSDLLEQYEVVD